MLTALSLLRRIGRWGLALIFPPRCVFCSRVLGGTEPSVCPRCAGVLPYTAKNEEECRDARKLQIGFAVSVIAPLYYEKSVRDALLRYKFSGLFSHAPVFAHLIAEAVGRAVASGEMIAPELVTFVPISKTRFRKRGYDQAELLAKAVAAELGVPLVKAVEKIAETPAQSTLDEKARRANVVGAYRALPEAAETVHGHHVLLIDDVVTTGATMAEAAKTVSYLLPGSIVCAAVAQTRPKTQKNG